jgi:hypothetical protein
LSNISKPVCALFLRSDWYCESEEFWATVPKHFFLIGGIQKGFINTKPEQDVFFNKIDINIELGNNRFSDEQLIPIRHMLSEEELLRYPNPKKKYDISVLGVLYDRRKTIYNLAKSSPFKVYNPTLLLRLRNMLNSFNKKYFFTNKILNFLFNRALEQSKVSYTDGTKLNYFIRKYLEIPVTQTLLIAHPLEKMEEYGFIDGINYISCNSENFLEKVTEILNDENKREKIVNNAYNLIKDRYTELYFGNKLEEILTSMHQGIFQKCYYKNGDLIVEKK